MAILMGNEVYDLTGKGMVGWKWIDLLKVMREVERRTKEEVGNRLAAELRALVTKL